MNKETFYFSHDYNARTDMKIKKLIIKYGYEGYGILWAIIEDLYQNENVLPLDYDCISYDLRADSDMIKSIINDFGLFGVDDETFGSLSIQRRLQMRNEKSRKARRSAKKRWIDDDANASKSDANASKNDANALRTHCDDDANALKNDANALRTHCDVDANAMRMQCDRNAIKERKVKDNKVKDNKVKENTNTNTICLFNFKKALLDYGFDEVLVDEWMRSRKTKKAVNSEFSYNSFISQIERAGAEKNEVMRTIAEQCVMNIEHSHSPFLNIQSAILSKKNNPL